MDLSSSTRTDTARGDRAQRRRDVLAAAAAALEEHGWDGFSIRDIAARAGVSGGAVYQWFSGKGEIWALLQTTRFRADTAEVESWSDDLSDVETVQRIVLLIAKNHADIGRHRFEFARGLKGRVPDYAVELTNAQHLLSAAIAIRIDALSPHEPVRSDLAARVSWTWAVGKGVGDHLVDSRFEVMGVEREDFLTTTAVCALAGLRAPDADTVA